MFYFIQFQLTMDEESRAIDQVEIDNLDRVKVWNQLPHDLVGAYTLLNIPLLSVPLS
jgi:hypothetical protein